MDLWSFIKIKLPRKLSNVFAFPVKKDYIMILGGRRNPLYDKRLNKVYDGPPPKDRAGSKNLVREERLDSNVYLLCHSK